MPAVDRIPVLLIMINSCDIGQRSILMNDNVLYHAEQRNGPQAAGIAAAVGRRHPRTLGADPRDAAPSRRALLSVSSCSAPLKSSHLG